MGDGDCPFCPNGHNQELGPCQQSSPFKLGSLGVHMVTILRCSRHPEPGPQSLPLTIFHSFVEV